MTEVLEQVSAGRLELATAVQSGPWVVINGRRAQQSRVIQPGRPIPHPAWDAPPPQCEAEVILNGVLGALERSGCSPRDVVRLDQYFRDWRVVPHYHVARRQVFGGAIPASTSILEQGLLFPSSRMEVQALARRKGDHDTHEFITPSGLEVSPHMGFSPIVKTPELVFLAGQMAEEGNSGIAAQAKVPRTHLWKGDAIRLETEYIIREKLIPSLQTTGHTVEDVIKAQVYLSDIADAAAFNDVWRGWFKGSPPATTIVPTAVPGFNCPDASIEINLIVSANPGSVRRFEAPDYPALYQGYPHAISASGLLFLSGLMALEPSGLASKARENPEEPFFSSFVEAEAEHIIARADAICTSAGYRLDDAVRILQFHTDLRDFYPAARAWQRRFGRRPIPITAVEVPGPLPLAEGRILADIWVGS